MAHAQEGTHNNPTARGLSQQFGLSSPSFADGDRIPRRHTADGENVSPRLTWSKPPAGAESLALVCEDPDAPRGTFVHWLAWNLPVEQRELAEAASPNRGGARLLQEGQNGFGQEGYGGPSPPPGKPHRYVFRLFALDERLELPARASRAEFDRAIEAHVLGEATLIGVYGR
ncbi:MAG: YbhB/YbcL family Raf kinase inhibitor-like protein [Myxococcota bacterium]